MNTIWTQMYWILMNNIAPTDEEGKQIPNLSEPWDIANKLGLITIKWIYISHQKRKQGQFCQRLTPYYNQQHPEAQKLSKSDFNSNSPDANHIIDSWLYGNGGPCEGLNKGSDQILHKTPSKDVKVDIGQHEFNVS